MGRGAETAWRRPVCFVFFLLSLFPHGESLKCYKCTDALSNDDCNTADNVVDCADEATGTSRLDTCQARVFRTPEHGIRYTKGCVQGPCTLGVNQDTALGLHPDCDRSKDVYDCDYCCDHDQCNFNAAPSASSIYVWLLISLGLLDAYMVKVIW